MPVQHLVRAREVRPALARIVGGRLHMLDARNFLSREQLQKYGYRYVAIGR